MMYQMYEAQNAMLAPMRAFSRLAGAALPHAGAASESLRGGYELWSRFGLTHVRPAFGIDSVVAEGEMRAIEIERVRSTSFADLLHFRVEGIGERPRVLVVAPLSGHFATLLRGTVRTLLRDFDVYLTDWHNARDVPASAGRFGVDEYIEHTISFLQALGPAAHVVAVCQPCPTVLAAVAVMAEAGDAAVPASLTLMAGPVDTRFNPTAVNTFAKSKSIEWFEQNMIDRVPWRYRGAGRRVYPGFLQVSAFVNMHPDRHTQAHRDLYRYVALGESAKADGIREFYDEYFTVLDLTEEFYLETVRLFFQDDALAQGTLTYRGRPVDPASLQTTSLLTIEGENDDVCGIGQTSAALALCTSIPAERKRYHLQPGVGHYGIFNGGKWNAFIAPVVAEHIRGS